MAVHKAKPRKTSPTFEKANLERLKKSSEVTESAKRLVDESKKLAHESQELIESLRKKRKAG
jgi:hypothetical protein